MVIIWLLLLFVSRHLWVSANCLDHEISYSSTAHTKYQFINYSIAYETKVFWEDTQILLNFLLQARLSVNAVTAGHYSRPVRIAQFIADLDAGFRLLNLKNDALRRRYDALKYDLKKAEEVVYDLTVRGLVNRPERASGAEGDDSVSVVATEQTACKS